MNMTNLSFRNHRHVMRVCSTGSAGRVPAKLRTMKMHRIICAAATIATLAVATGCVTEEQREAKLQAQAKVSRADAEKTALAKVPGGTIKEGELEKEKGKLIWSFDISSPGTSDIKEVQVNAISGEVVSVETESGAAEAKEKK
jgi:Peptidase propeptide and YPEB domain